VNVQSVHSMIACGAKTRPGKGEKGIASLVGQGGETVTSRPHGGSCRRKVKKRRDLELKKQRTTQGAGKVPEPWETGAFAFSKRSQKKGDGGRRGESFQGEERDPFTEPKDIKTV